MYMHRKVSEYLKQWKNSKYRKPLIIQGARQVGKTYAILEFGRQNYDNVAYFNFQTSASLSATFSENISPSYLLPVLAHISGQTITKSHPVRTGQLVDGVDEVTAEWLRKWQTPRKYYHMIESATFTKKDGFTIVLKEGFTNDATGSRLIHSDSLKVFKPLIKHSHSV